MDIQHEETHHQQHPHLTISEFYAVRHGREANNCIFLSWEDAKKHILNYEQGEYCVFDVIQDAVSYISPNTTFSVGKELTKALIADEGGDASQPNDDLDEVTDAAATLNRINTDHLYEPKEVEEHILNRQQLQPDAMEEESSEEEEEHESSSSTSRSAPEGSTITTLSKIPKETETFEVDGRTIQKRRPSKNWMSMYHKLQEYRNKSGSFYIPATDTENIPLKRWISEQKHQYKCYKLGRKHFSSQMKRQLLNHIGFDFEFHSFDERLEQLRKYKEVNGTVNVPLDDPLLGSWMETQRRQLLMYNKGKESRLNADKVRRLREVGVDVVNVHKPIIIPRQETSKDVKKWDDMFEELMKYKRETGHCQVAKQDTNNQSLYKWINQQRLEYKKLRKEHGNKMTASRLQKLNDVGFVFNPRNAYLRWEERLDQLKKFKEEHGHLRVPVTDPTIGEFVARQRVEHAKFVEGKPCNMTADRARDLEDLGFIFQVGKRRFAETKAARKTWDERFDELVQFKQKNGHTLVPQNNSTLGEWVHKQRKMYKLLKSGKPSGLSTERALKLADIGFVFDASGYRRGRKPVVREETSSVSTVQVPVPLTLPQQDALSQMIPLQPQQSHNLYEHHHQNDHGINHHFQNLPQVQHTQP